MVYTCFYNFYVLIAESWGRQSWLEISLCSRNGVVDSLEVQTSRTAGRARVGFDPRSDQEHLNNWSQGELDCHAFQSCGADQVVDISGSAVDFFCATRFLFKVFVSFLSSPSLPIMVQPVDLALNTSVFRSSGSIVWALLSSFGTASTSPSD